MNPYQWFIVIKVYSQIEIEDEKNICEGREGCWTLRDSEEIDSFAVLTMDQAF